MAVHLLFCIGTVADNVLNPGLFGLGVVAGAITLAGIPELSGFGFESVRSDGEFLCLQEPSALKYLGQKWTSNGHRIRHTAKVGANTTAFGDRSEIRGIESIAELPRMRDRRPIDCEPVFTGTTSAPEQTKSMTLG
jgi:hypothetical protein